MNKMNTARMGVVVGTGGKSAKGVEELPPPFRYINIHSRMEINL